METDLLKTMAGLGGIPVVAAIVEVLKRQVLAPTAPSWTSVLLAFAVAEAWTVAVALVLHTPDVPVAGLMGIIVWLTAMGGYSGAKTLLQSGSSS